MQNRASRVASGFCILVLASGLARAQFNGNVSGNVQDPKGAAIPNATLTLTNTATGSTFSTKNDEGGGYRFVSLAPGNYQLVVAAPGFANKTVTFSLLTEETLNVPVQLAVGSVSEQIVVTAQAKSGNALQAGLPRH